ncbi:MAG TPA: carboxypeptidase regulatory-like domain-containing protein, partial [Blastocatellia bacterium]|nr:carboxypeptidase regulatory-like domain-containing protein [Blastocatellia bacterium]
MRRTLVTILLIGMLALAAQSAAAQTQITTGVIQGTVLDPQGAAVVGAAVEVRNLDTNYSARSNSDADGWFIFLQLPPGRYTVTVSKQGFATLIQEKLSLTVGQAITLPINMKVSQVEEKITIEASPTIDTVKTESSSTLNEQAVNSTPILGRKFEDLLTLTPGVSIVQGPDGDEINFVGQRGIFNNVSMDGGDYNNGFFGEQMGGQRAAIDITLDAVKEFQVIPTGASAEFGRTAGGVVNVITKSGTNAVHGSLFYFQRLEALTANTSDGKPLKDFHREQFGGTIGGPIVKDKVFFFGAFEQIISNLTRPNLSEQLGPTPCPVSTPTIAANENLINSNPDCQRLALINFFQTSLSQAEGNPVNHPIRSTAALGKLDWYLSPANKLAVSYNFAYSRNENQTFDVAGYGNSANGIEGPSKIHAFNANLFSTLSPRMVNEAHFTYSRENRAREAVDSNVPADTAMGFVDTFRFGNPFFLQPNIDEIFWRSQIRDNLTLISGRHTIKMGGEWIHSLNDQVFRGFFTGRYIFDSVSGFLRYSSAPAPGGFGPRVRECFSSSGVFTGWVTGPASCPAGSTVGGPLLLFLQGAGRTGLATDETGASNISNEEYALFVQDGWQINHYLKLNYGLRWEAQIFPDPVTPPNQTAYGSFLNDPRFPSDGTLPSQKKMFQPRVGFAWDLMKTGRSVLRASWGIYNARQNMLTQVGSITTNGVQQQTIFLDSSIIASGATPPTWPGLVTPPSLPAGTFPLFTGVRVFSKDYANPRIYTTNVAFEQQLSRNVALYFDFTHSKGVHLTRFFNANFDGAFSPQLGEVQVTASSAKALYRGFTVGLRKRFSQRFQFEGNYVFSKDMDDDSNERDPFTDRVFDHNDYKKDYSLSDRDIKHKFNVYSYIELPWELNASLRIQARSAQPITPSPRVVNGVDQGRNSLRKDNEYFSFDWRLVRDIRFGERFKLSPMLEMFNTFNNDNN